MADEGTLATTAQVLFQLGENASTNQKLEANTNFAILWAEAQMSKAAKRDLVGNYATITAYLKQWLADVAVAGAVLRLENQNQNTWQLATTQSKMLFSDDVWQDGLKSLTDADTIARLNL